MDNMSRPGAVPDSGEKERLFQCSTCKRSFTRVDHLMRHVRSHTKQRPYVCPTCSKGFARVDLLKRHAANHTSDGPNKRQKTDIVRQSRVGQACEACSHNHLRCEDDKPCTRCRKKNIICRVTAADQDELEDMYAAQDLLDLSNNLEIAPVASKDAITTEPLESDMNGPSVVVPEHLTVSLDGMNQIARPELQSTVHAPDARNSCPDDMLLPFNTASPIDPLLPDYLQHVPPFESCFSGHATPRGIMDLSFNWDVDLNGLDFAFLDQYTVQDTFHEDMLSINTEDTGQQLHFQQLPDDVAERAEAFERSVWRYMPPRHNPGAAEEPNLALPDAEDSPPHSQMMPRRAIKERISHVTRDKLLALVLSTSNPANVKRISAGFPSLELLDGIVQIFLTAPSIDAGYFMHLPTFSPSRLHPELFAILVAAGATSTPDTSLQKLGFALHEASRVGISRAFDDDNSAIRDLQFLQTQLLQDEVGMWSGISRKMEIAESFLQPPVTMLRRGGRFRRSTWKEIIPTPQDDGFALEEKWKQWVLQESWLRLAYRFFELDRQSSIALLKPPLISYSEMQLPLPHSDILWHASSATAWKSAYLVKPASPTKRKSPMDCILDLDCLACHACAGAVYLYMVWGMVWEYKQMSTLMAKSKSTSLVLSSRHQELSKYCEDFRVSGFSISKDVEVVVEVMLMHLNAPMDDMQTFAGIAGPEEARRAYPVLRDWAASDPARQALWHAGQVLRIAEAMPKGTLRDFVSMAVYQAGLTLWVYGLLKRPNANPSPGNDLQAVYVDGDESVDIHRFIRRDHGEPTLRTAGTQGAMVPLKNATEVIGAVMSILQRNHEATEGSRPPLVDNLVQLMQGLRCATK